MRKFLLAGLVLLPFAANAQYTYCVNGSCATRESNDSARIAAEKYWYGGGTVGNTVSTATLPKSMYCDNPNNCIALATGANVISGTPTTHGVAVSSKPKEPNVMLEVIGILTCLALFAVAITAVIVLVTAVSEAHTRAKKLERRISIIESGSEVTEEEISRVTCALTSKNRDDALAAIIALRSV